MLERFAGLSGRSVQHRAVCDFALTHGVLGVDGAGRPLSSLPGPEANRFEAERIRQKRYREPIAAWREWSEKVAVALKATAAIHGGRKIPDESLLRFGHVLLGSPSETTDWHVDANGNAAPIRMNTDAEVLAVLRQYPLHRGIAGAITGWLYSMGLGLGVAWPDARRPARLQLTGGSAGCLGSIVLQLALLATRARGCCHVQRLRTSVCTLTTASRRAAIVLRELPGKRRTDSTRPA